MPIVINATKVVTYRVDSIVNDLLDMETEPTIEAVLERVKDWAVEDLSSMHDEIIYTDEHGDTIDE